LAKKTTMNTTGGAIVMGSYPYPPNGMIEIDYEFILVFKKPGTIEKVPKEIKEISKLTKEEWKEYFTEHWRFGSEKQINHEAMFPEELPKRLIKMYSFVGDTVLDPFVGSGTTVKVALELKRNAIGYEINENFLEIIKEKIGIKNSLFKIYNIEIIKRYEKIKFDDIEYVPSIQDAKPQIDTKKLNFKKDALYKVVDIIDENTIKINNGHLIKFLGVKINDKDKIIKYFKEDHFKKEIRIKLENNSILKENTIFAYVYLKNKILINAYIIKTGITQADRERI